MKILSQDSSNYEILIETLDDLWVLSQILGENTRVFGKTERKVKIGDENNYKIAKKIIFVNINVTKVKFENEILKVMGEIQNETDFTSVGSSHTLNYKLSEKIKFEKTQMLNYEKKLLENAIKSKATSNLLVLFDKDILFCAEFSEFSHTVLFKQEGLGSKKYSSEQINEEEEKYQIIINYLNKDYSKIILAGPGIFKDKLQKYIKDKTGKNTLTFSWNEVSTNAVSKVIDNIKKSGLLAMTQLTYEMEHIETFLKNISQKTKSTYGLQNIHDAVNSGSCEILLISTKFIEKEKESGGFSQINELMRLVEQLNGKLVIVNSKNESGKILDGLTGIGAILRY